MTTIAFDGRYLAADGRMTCGNIINGSKTKKLFPLTATLHGVQQEIVFFGAGGFATINSVVEWLKQGNDPYSFDPDQVRPVCEQGEVDFGYITQDGQVHTMEFELMPYDGEVPWSGGSGFPFAIMAMRMGMNAVQATYEAMKHDSGSGGTVTCFDVDEWKWVEDVDSLR